MIIDYDHNPNITEEQRLQSLKESVQMALNDKPSYKASEIGGLIDMFYPVGSYYETSDTTFNPNTAWGGTWSLETEGQVHVSSGANYTVGGALTDTSDGGSKDAIVPSHSHGTSVTQPTFTIPNHTHAITGKYFVYSDNANANNISVQVATSGTRRKVDGGSDNTNNVFHHVQNTSSTGGGGGCTRTTNVGVTVNSEGVSTTDANMQPYIVVNRWHRTA